MRIISGKFKGSKLYLPKNPIIRPLKDMVRESIFNFLTHSNKISFKLEKTNILDLYSGTGSFGLECVSRGANTVFFVEKNVEANEILQKNIEKLKVKEVSKVFFDDAFNVIKKLSKDQSFNIDLIFCDPPFKDLNLNKLIELISSENLLKKNGLIIIHRHKNTEEKISNYLKVIDERVYGLSKIFFAKPILPFS